MTSNHTLDVSATTTATTTAVVPLAAVAVAPLAVMTLQAAAAVAPQASPQAATAVALQAAPCMQSEFIDSHAQKLLDQWSPISQELRAKALPGDDVPHRVVAPRYSQVVGRVRVMDAESRVLCDALAKACVYPNNAVMSMDIPAKWDALAALIVFCTNGPHHLKKFGVVPWCYIAIGRMAPFSSIAAFVNKHLKLDRTRHMTTDRMEHILRIATRVANVPHIDVWLRAWMAGAIHTAPTNTEIAQDFDLPTLHIIANRLLGRWNRYMELKSVSVAVPRPTMLPAAAVPVAASALALATTLAPASTLATTSAPTSTRRVDGAAKEPSLAKPPIVDEKTSGHADKDAKAPTGDGAAASGGKGANDRAKSIAAVTTPARFEFVDVSTDDELPVDEDGPVIRTARIIPASNFKSDITVGNKNTDDDDKEENDDQVKYGGVATRKRQRDEDVDEHLPSRKEARSCKEVRSRTGGDELVPPAPVVVAAATVLAVTAASTNAVPTTTAPANATMLAKTTTAETTSAALTVTNNVASTAASTAKSGFGASARAATSTTSVVSARFDFGRRLLYAGVFN